MKRWLVILSVVLLPALAADATQAQSIKSAAKIPDNLIALYEQYSRHQAQRSALSFKSDDPLIRQVDDHIVIDAVASGDVEILRADLVSLGMEGAVAFGRVVSGRLPISSISAVAALTSLRFAQPAKAVTNAGSVTTQGDQSMQSDVTRATFGLDGAGITLGVLSDSYNCLGGAATDITNEDLSPVTVLQEVSSCAGATDEGRAMLQIVHDVAPGGNLTFASAFNGMASFAANITALKNIGARVIVDDVIYLAEPMFQDGIVAQAVNGVVSNGVAYFSSAGNQARQSYQSVFRPGDFFADGAIPSAPGAPAFFGGTAHNFNPSGGGPDQFLSVTLPAGTTMTIVLQWDSPFFSVSGSPGTQNDLDLYVLDPSATQVLAGTTFNNIGGDAVELFGATNTGLAPLNLNLMIVKHSGLDPGMLKFVYYYSGAPPTINEFNTQSGTIYGHANATGAEAVGAARYSNTPAFGVLPPLLESFSSSGTTPILFDLAGNRLATPDLRADKPEIVAPDGADTTFFGSFDFDGSGFPNFFGTSAAAPHAAGVAALLLQAKPTLAPGKIYRSLENSAVDMDVAGFDDNTGFGLIQADAALAMALQPTPVDFDGDGISDIAVCQTSTGNWSFVQSTAGFGQHLSFGGANFLPVPGDYDGDGVIDTAIYDTTNGHWFIAQSTDGFRVHPSFGGVGFVPVPGDYDGDGRTDTAIHETVTGHWFIAQSMAGFRIHPNFGGAGFVPVPGDYDGDGKTDTAVYETTMGHWFIAQSMAGFRIHPRFGGSGFVPVPGDYDGDGKIDDGVYQTSTGHWFWVGSTGGFSQHLNFGGSGYMPVVGDYDGDGQTDRAVYQTATGHWFIAQSTAGFLMHPSFGGTGFVPVLPQVTIVRALGLL